MTPKKPYTFLISPDLDRGLKLVKTRDGVPEGETIRRALGEYLAKKGATASESKPIGGRSARKRGSSG